MKRPWIVAGLALAGVGGFWMASGAYQALVVRTTTTSRLSPDETIRARLIETSPPGQVDRNFLVRLDYLAEGRAVTIYESPDEGHPAGTERLIWSTDGTRILLVGRHFFVREDLFLDNGDQLYFLYHLPTGKAWCNSEQSPLPPLKAEQVAGLQFTEPVVLKER